MIVCIAEKPSVAKDIARVLGANSSRDGYMEGNGYQVTWTFGHLCTLKEPHDYTPSWKAWSLSKSLGIRFLPYIRRATSWRPIRGRCRGQRRVFRQCKLSYQFLFFI